MRHVLDDVDAGAVARRTATSRALRTRTHGDIDGDLFIDCSGLASVLIGQHFGIGVRSQKHLLFNDTALALQVPYADAGRAHRLRDHLHGAAGGWTWDIGLPDAARHRPRVFQRARVARRGRAAAARPRRRTGGLPSRPTPRRIAFDPGYRERFWHRNCVAVGLSAGFVEPLEASALALVELSAAMISDEMPATRAEMALVERRFNDAFTYRWERVVDFLKLHYVLSRRDDTDYWRDAPRRRHACPIAWPTCSRCGAIARRTAHDFFRVEEVFPAASYQYVLHGMGFLPEPSARLRHPERGRRRRALLPRDRPPGATHARRPCRCSVRSSPTSARTACRAPETEKPP